MSDELREKLENHSTEVWPTKDWLVGMGWPVHEVEILGAVRREEQQNSRYRDWDQRGLGKALRNWAASYGFEETRADRLQHENGTYVEIGYALKTVSLRWGRAPQPGNVGGMEGRRDFTRPSMSLEDRNQYDELLKEMSTRE